MSNQKSILIEIPVENIEELNLIRGNLLTAIKLIADQNEHNCTPRSAVTHTIGTLTSLIQHFDTPNPNL